MYAPQLPHSMVKEVVHATVSLYLAAKEQEDLNSCTTTNGEFVFLESFTKVHHQNVDESEDDLEVPLHDGARWGI